jgi:hypothetical protein
VGLTKYPLTPAAHRFRRQAAHIIARQINRAGILEKRPIRLRERTPLIIGRADRVEFAEAVLSGR